MMGSKADKLLYADLSGQIISGAIEVHRQLGPGLLESTYRTCLVCELGSQGLRVQQEVPLSIRYKGITIPGAYRADLLIESIVILELKSVEKLLPVHGSQLLTYLKLCDLRVGLLFNFNVTQLKNGIRRFII